MPRYSVTIRATYLDVVIVEAVDEASARKIVGSLDFNYEDADAVETGIDPDFSILSIKEVAPNDR